MLLVGFAHHGGAIARPGSPDLSAYALPDGTVPVLCRTGMDDPSPAALDGSGGCEACRLVAAPGLLPGPSIVVLPPADQRVAKPKVGTPQRAVILSAPVRARAPPAIRLS
ncbi:MAG: hypothetical protein EAZ99_07360 [Alphaproteobacteria bacterium]|nr:MAG: hypothetical protein EAZ99_07360 [Alphaproteobacteria bacterium]